MFAGHVAGIAMMKQVNRIRPKRLRSDEDCRCRSAPACLGALRIKVVKQRVRIERKQVCDKYSIQNVRRCIIVVMRKIGACDKKRSLAAQNFSELVSKSFAI